MSQNSDCPVNKTVVLSYDAKEGQQSTFPLESNLDVLISSMLKGINNEYTKPISVVPAGDITNVHAEFVKLATPDVVIVPPVAPAAPAVPAAPAAPAAQEPVTEPVLTSPMLAPSPSIPISNLAPELAPAPAPVTGPMPELVTPNQPPAEVMLPTPLTIPSPEVKVEKFEATTSAVDSDNVHLISKVIGILFLILVGYLILVKLKIIRYY